MINIYKNNRKEIVSTDGIRWWHGADSDESIISFNQLQPVSALFPSDNGISINTVNKTRAVFISCLKNLAPKATPENNAEKELLRVAWNEARKIMANQELKIQSVGTPVFSTKWMLVGTADVIVSDNNGNVFTMVYSPAGYSYGGAINAVVRMLHCGLPIKCEDDMFSTYKISDLVKGLQAIILRTQTDWYANHLTDIPF